MAFLVRKKPDGTVLDRWEITTKVVVVGRGDSADIQIKDERASREHLAIAPREHGYLLQDLNSTNGTWLNGNRIKEATLRSNDKIRLGQTVLVFEMDKSKGLATMMGELEKETRGFQTLMGEISAKTEPPSEKSN